ncbi:hypothetical protein CMO84_09990 [Candidatus Woesearchaeota archaeon]|jgi:hypothetical protein|nr:hypothetical protein [Candidatus Woesearchaeota archaeon]MDP6938588.1 glycosyltransferase [Planctomycetota bacterium]
MTARKESQREILYLTHESPWPADAGHKLRYRQLMEALGEYAQVHLASFRAPDRHSPTRSEDEEGAGVIGHTLHSLQVRIRRRPLSLAKVGALSLWTGRPYSEIKFQDRTMAASIQGLIERIQPCAILATLPMLQYVKGRLAGIPLIMDCHNLEHQLWDQALPLAPALLRPFVRREATLVRRLEAKGWGDVDGIVAICEEDSRFIRQRTSHPVMTIPPAFPERAGPREGGRCPSGFAFDAAMLGVWTWGPNEIALESLLGALERRSGGNTLRIAIGGRGIRPELGKRLEKAGVSVLGYVEDLAEFYANTACVLAPYTVGGGVRLKVLEALSWGVPVMGTALALRGIRGEAGSGVLLGETADDLLDHALIVGRDPIRRAALERAGWERARVWHSHEGTGEKLRAFLETVTG